MRPTRPLDGDGVPRLTVFGVPPCQDTAITRARLDALNAPYVYVDLEQDVAADTYVRALFDGNRVTPTVVVGVEDEIAAEPDIAAVDRLAAMAWPGLPMERPRLSLPLGHQDAAADALVTPPAPSVLPDDLLDLPAEGPPRPTAAGTGIPSRWGAGPGNRLALVLLIDGGCLACLGYSRLLLRERPAFDASGVNVAVVLAGELPATAKWRGRISADARVLADAGGAWRRRVLDRLVAASDTPGLTTRFADHGVALLLVDGDGGVRRMAGGPEAGHLPDPAYLAEAVALEAARDTLGSGA